jgi:hypothetical protein
MKGSQDEVSLIWHSIANLYLNPYKEIQWSNKKINQIVFWNSRVSNIWSPSINGTTPNPEWFVQSPINSSTVIRGFLVQKQTRNPLVWVCFLPPCQGGIIFGRPVHAVLANQEWFLPDHKVQIVPVWQGGIFLGQKSKSVPTGQGQFPLGSTLGFRKKPPTYQPAAGLQLNQQQPGC